MTQRKVSPDAITRMMSSLLKIKHYKRKMKLPAPMSSGLLRCDPKLRVVNTTMAMLRTNSYRLWVDKVKSVSNLRATSGQHWSSSEGHS